MAEPAGLLPSVQLRPYQKQSLAFMLDIEQSTDSSLLGDQAIGHRRRVRGGILADEMGMGKTMVCISLVLANPPKPGATSKTTLVIVNNTLVQQWYDECKRYAPKLNVQKHYASTKMRDEATMNAADIVISTPHMTLPGQHAGSPLCFHRVIIDESHLFEAQRRSESTWFAQSSPTSVCCVRRTCGSAPGRRSR